MGSQLWPPNGSPSALVGTKGMVGPSRIYVVAGPRACGKSTFIERIAEGPADFLPAALAPLTKAHGPVYLMGLADEDLSNVKDVLVHVDLLTPFSDSSALSEEALISEIQPGAFAEYPGTSLFRLCANLVVLTLRVSHLTTSHRWKQRSAEQGRTNSRLALAHIYSGTSGGAGYAALYNAWDSYIAGLPSAANWDVLESPDGSGYSVVWAGAGRQPV